MKQKIKFKNFDGKDTIKEKEIPAPDHLQAQIKYPSIIFKNKKKYNRKQKYKKSFTED